MIRNVCPQTRTTPVKMPTLSPPPLVPNPSSSLSPPPLHPSILRSTRSHRRQQQETAMATTLAGVSLSTTKVTSKKAELPKLQPLHGRILPWAAGHRTPMARRMVLAASGPSTPPGISEKVSESIKKAEEACEDNAESGECAAAWDEVEELSAAASHARDKLKDSSDPLENYCKDNPEADECRTYDD